MANIASLAVQIVGTTGGLSASLKESEGLLNKFQKSAAGKGVSSLASGLKSGIGSAFDGVSGMISKAALSPLTMVGGLLGGIAGIGGVAEIVTQSISLAAELEDSQTTFKVMLGDMGKAKSLMADITDLAARTPLTTQELVKSGGMLLSADVKDTQIVPTLTMLGDVAAGVNQPLNEIVYLYNQVRTQGRLYGDDLRQFTGRGIPLISAFASSLNVSESAVKGLVEEGKIGFPELQAALLGITSSGGRFFGMMDERSKTFSGMMSTLKDNWQQLGAKFGQILIEEFDLKPLIEKFSVFAGSAKADLDWFRPWFSDVKDGAKALGVELVNGLQSAVVWMAAIVEDARELKDQFMSIASMARVGGAAAKLLNPMHLIAPNGTAIIRDGKNLYAEYKGKSPEEIEAEKAAREARFSGAMTVRMKEFKTIVDRLANQFITGISGSVETRKAFDLSDVAKEISTTFKPDMKAGGYDQLGFVMGGLGMSVAAGGDLIKSKTEALAMGFGGLSVVAAELKTSINQLNIESKKLTADQVKHVRTLTEEMDPFIKIGREMSELRDIRKLGGFNKEGVTGQFFGFGRDKEQKLFDFAQGKLFEPLMKDVAEGSKLAASALKGSSEAASIINQNKTDQQQSALERMAQGLADAKEIQTQQRDLMKRFVEYASKAGLIEVK
ncbi:tape measure protein [Zavarzinella formosa]|uniref:tape measure protein n=1 Tax=Zavarzinella formosa TaxID=360055 RepID=UPI0003096156|nr:tape measure protein [Zavarzinella formosa]